MRWFVAFDSCAYWRDRLIWRPFRFGVNQKLRRCPERCPKRHFLTAAPPKQILFAEHTAADRLAKLEAVLASTAPPAEDVALLAALLSLPSDGRYPVLELSPQQRKVRTFIALLRRLSGLALREPVLFLFEDAHWSDPSSIEHRRVR